MSHAPGQALAVIPAKARVSAYYLSPQGRTAVAQAAAEMKAKLQAKRAERERMQHSQRVQAEFARLADEIIAKGGRK